MDAKNRNDLLFALVQNYVLDKRKNQVLMRESDISYMHSKGMLQGACMAFECEIVETDRHKLHDTSRSRIEISRNIFREKERKKWIL